MPPLRDRSSTSSTGSTSSAERQRGREVSYGRYTFRGGKIFDGRGREIPRSQAGLSIGELRALSESQIDFPEQSIGGGGMGGGGGFTDGTSGSRIGGTGVNIRGGGGGGSITNPYIRAESDLIDYLNWKYGSDIRADAPSRIAGTLGQYEERIQSLMKSGGTRGRSLTREAAERVEREERSAAQRKKNWETVIGGGPGAAGLLNQAIAQEDPNSAAFKQYSQMLKNLPQQKIF